MSKEQYNKSNKNEIKCICCKKLTKTEEEKSCYNQWFICSDCYYIYNILQKYSEIHVDNDNTFYKFIQSIPEKYVRDATSSTKLDIS